MGFERLAGLADVVHDGIARLAAMRAEALRAIRQSFAGKARHVPRADGLVGMPVQGQPRPLALADHWSKVTSILSSAVDGARVATEMQSAATQQLDLAQYGLITLVDELSTVMTIPGRSRRSATVHAFGASETRTLLGQALAA